MYNRSGIYITGMEVCIKKYGESYPDLTEHIPEAIIRRLDDFSTMVLHAARKLLSDTALTNMEDLTCGAVFNTYWGPLKSTESFFISLLRDGAENVSPSVFPNLVTNASLGKVCKLLKILNSTTFLVAVSPLEYAMELMRKKKNKYMLIEECDELYDTNVSACISAGLINQDSMTFQNTNTKCAGGYGAFLLQQLTKLSDYNGMIYAKVLASTSIYAPMVVNQLEYAAAVKRFLLAVRLALREAELTVGDVGAVVSFANGSEVVGDIDDTAMLELFGNQLGEVLRIKPKMLSGETFSEGLSMALKAGIEVLPEISGKAVLCCSYTIGNNINVTLISGVIKQ